MGIGITNRAYDNIKKRKDNTPTLDAQVVDLPKENENEKQIVIQRPDNDADKNVNLPATSTGNNLTPPPVNPPVDLAALNGGEVAPIGNRDLAEDVEFTVDKQEPFGIEGYKQAGESWVEGKEEEQPKIEKDDRPAIEDKTEKEEGQKAIEQDETLELEDKREKPEYEYVGKLTDKDFETDDEEEKDKKDVETDSDPNASLRDLLNSGATDFSINDIVESEQEVPHYRYRSLLNRS